MIRMIELTNEEKRGKILEKLARMKKFEGAHTSVRDAAKGWPKHMVGEIFELIDRMIKDGLLKCKPTEYGKQISINLEKKDEVERLIRIFLEKKYTKQIR